MAVVCLWFAVLLAPLAVSARAQSADIRLGRTQLARPSACTGSCSKYGTCNEELGRCDCLKNMTGEDCSELLDEKGLDERCKYLLFHTMKECTRVVQACTGYETRKKRAHIYVYELPPNMTVWGNTRRLDRPTHNLFAQRLLSSGARTANDAIDYIRKMYPWWDKYGGGGRHFAFHTGDLGMIESTRESLPLVDVVVPVYVSSGHFKHFGFEKTPMHPNATSRLERKSEFFFAGRICGDRQQPDESKPWPHCEGSVGYSAGVRQQVHFQHHNRSGYNIMIHAEDYGKEMKTSKFCLAPLGGGHGQRQILVSFMGCIPVTIGDHVMQPFEPELDWTQFSVQPLESQISDLHEILDAVDEQWRACKRKKVIG
eukprot:gene16628-22875_t